MTEYKIERFDPILNGGTSNTALPVIYIKTDSEFFEFAKKNNYLIGCKIKNSGTVYDDKVLSCILNTNFLKRPNFFKQTGLDAITLLVKWSGYPEYGSTPTVSFFEINTQTNNQSNTQTNNESNNDSNNEFNTLRDLKENTSTTPKNNTLQIISPTIVFLIFLSIVFAVKNYGKN